MSEELNLDKRKIDESEQLIESKKQKTEGNDFQIPNGVAPIKKEYIISLDSNVTLDDDAAEGATADRGEEETNNNKKKGKKQRGQNKARKLTQAKEQVKLCISIVDPEKPCIKGELCNLSHDIDSYFAQKPQDLEGTCSVWEALGYCPVGIKCRWLSSHFDKETNTLKYRDNYNRNDFRGEVNWVSNEDKRIMQKKQADLPVSDMAMKLQDNTKPLAEEERKILEAQFKESVIKPGEKKKLDHRNKKILSPLATVGNLPFRRLMKTLGTDVTYSEMTLTLPLIQGKNSEWALFKAHKSEYPGFGTQIATNKYWQAAKACEAIAKFTPNVSEINLNCGCPIDLLFKKGEGSGVMTNGNKMRNLLKNMAYCSGEIPVTVKMRMAIQDGKPLAIDLTKKLLGENGGDVAAITVHGRSRQQRYTKEANWDYIEQLGKVVKEYNEEYEEKKDVSDRPNPVYLIGNGDCYTYEDWYHHVGLEGVDSVMVARGALIKPWIFEEVEAQQYLDKSATERLEILRTYTNFALEHWGTDEYGLNTARRYLCEFMSFTHRYIPVGILERLPPKLNERPPKWRGRNELETLLASDNYQDWIKVSEMFLGKAGDGFTFVPKHKSNSYSKSE